MIHFTLKVANARVIHIVEIGSCGRKKYMFDILFANSIQGNTLQNSQLPVKKQVDLELFLAGSKKTAHIVGQDNTHTSLCFVQKSFLP